ncbi:MAG: ABC transporter permease subunit [Bacteroides sp.]|nr:ABC transporter permease subunit [Bacillota bacterium]MCM1393355.1 ABC transporter permease subunit [[Eubacterium] siraeum]MCM1454909.1 ABC transporter permease subunit [Bacteroides sp.]
MAKFDIGIDKKKAKSIALNIFYLLLALAIALALWAIIAKAKNNELVLPMPSAVLGRFFRLGGEVGFWQSVGWSILRTLGCFALSFVSALLFASLAGLFNPLHRVLSPIVSFLRAAPTVAVILILYAFMPEKDALSIAVGFLIAFPIMYAAFYSAITGVDRDLLKMAKLYKVRGLDKILFIYLPSIANCLFDTGRATLSLTLKVVVAAEILTNVSQSIGGKIQFANSTSEISYLLAWTLVAIVFSFVLEFCAAILKKVWEILRCRI